MSENGCAQCAALQEEIVRLEWENRLLRAIIYKLEAQLKRIRHYTGTVMQHSARILSEHQPRGTWSLHKGREQVASRVYQLAQRQ